MRNKYTKELLEPIVARSNTWAEVCRELGIKPATGSQSNLTNKAKLLGLDYSHFNGKTFNKGRLFGYKRPIEYYLVDDGSAYINSDALRRRLLKEGVKEHRCEICDATEWIGKPIPLELDHINRNHSDNRLSNLQIICPNCHAQKTAIDRCAGLV